MQLKSFQTTFYSPVAIWNSIFFWHTAIHCMFSTMVHNIHTWLIVWVSDHSISLRFFLFLPVTVETNIRPIRFTLIQSRTGYIFPVNALCICRKYYHHIICVRQRVRNGNSMFFMRINWFNMQTGQLQSNRCYFPLYHFQFSIFIFQSIGIVFHWKQCKKKKTMEKSRHFALDTEWKFYNFCTTIAWVVFKFANRLLYYMVTLPFMFFYSTIIDLSGFVDNRYGAKKSEEQQMCARVCVS